MQVYTWDAIIDGLQIDLDENFIYETEKTHQRIRKRCRLRDLETIRVLDQNPSYSKPIIYQN